MKRSELSAYTLRAIEITGGSAEFRDEGPPTWDGRMWHLARVSSEMHVLHEIAHWIVASRGDRTLANYGLGGDPDGGPRTPVWFERLDVESEADVSAVARELRRWIPATAWRLAYGEPDLQNVVVAAAIERRNAHEESLASVVTVLLAHRAGVNWRHAIQVAKFDALVRSEVGQHSFWTFVAELAERGVDLEDPLAPFERAAAWERGAAE